MENQQKEIFANCSQTHFAMRKFRRPISQCENSPTQIRNAKISQCEISQCQMQFRNAKIFAIPHSQCEISQCQMQFRNAKIFAIPHSQCENFAMRNFAMPNTISQCQMPFRNANFEFTLPIPISQCENFAIPNSQCENFAMRNFAMPKPISHCENHCLCEIHPAKFTGLVILCN